MSTGGLILVALAIAVGLVGIFVPFLPGSLLVWAAIAAWRGLQNPIPESPTDVLQSSAAGFGVVNGGE